MTPQAKAGLSETGRPVIFPKRPQGKRSEFTGDLVDIVSFRMKG
jgi:hypothetical protein